jgi:hypothetical protein
VAAARKSLDDERDDQRDDDDEDEQPDSPVAAVALVGSNAALVNLVRRVLLAGRNQVRGLGFELLDEGNVVLLGAVEVFVGIFADGAEPVVVVVGGGEIAWAVTLVAGLAGRESGVLAAVERLVPIRRLAGRRLLVLVILGAGAPREGPGRLLASCARGVLRRLRLSWPRRVAVSVRVRRVRVLRRLLARAVVVEISREVVAEDSMLAGRWKIVPWRNRRLARRCQIVVGDRSARLGFGFGRWGGQGQRAHGCDRRGAVPATGDVDRSVANRRGGLLGERGRKQTRVAHLCGEG